ncbi:MAG: class I SAM-dependent methyltransferase [Chitinophagaceae bacterium]|nr:class I SAM-dependent methyltransferase [Chitinophagaceae bacterium]
MSLPVTILHSKQPSQDELDLSPLYPISIQELDKLHWSPLPVICRAVRFLAESDGANVLDIGSGSGKFCLTASYLRPDAIFYGVEQRGNLVDQANLVKDLLDRPNVKFLHKNFTQLDLRAFNSFYFYNSFFENLPGSGRIDDSIAYSTELYRYYSYYLNKQLEGMPPGTKVATYCSWNDEIPPGYQFMESHMDGLLKFWIKD